MLNTEELSNNAYCGVGFDSDEMLNNIFNKSAEIDIEEPKGHVLNKEEFMAKVRAHCAERDKRKALDKQNKVKAIENDFRSYQIERAVYRRRIAINSRRK